MLAKEESAGSSTRGILYAPHHPAKAKRVVQLFMAGAASHLDLWDFKPDLIKHHGEPSDFGEHVEAFQNGLGPWMKPVWEFKPYGSSGKRISEPVAPLGAVIDDIAFVHNLIGKTGVHSQATYLQATGFDKEGGSLTCGCRTHEFCMVTGKIKKKARESDGNSRLLPKESTNGNANIRTKEL